MAAALNVVSQAAASSSPYFGVNHLRRVNYLRYRPAAMASCIAAGGIIKAVISMAGANSISNKLMILFC